MKQKALPNLTYALLFFTLAISSGLNAQDWAIKDWKVNPDRPLNPETEWLLEAKWGLFCSIFSRSYLPEQGHLAYEPNNG